MDDQTEDDGADHRAGERADDAGPPAVGQEDREVPERDRDHDPDEQAHQRGLPCLRLRGFLGFGPSPAASPSAGPLAVPPSGGFGGASPRARARRPPVGGRGRGAAGAPRLRPPSRRGWAPMPPTPPGEPPGAGPGGGGPPPRRPPRGAAGATSPGPPCSTVAYAGT